VLQRISADWQEPVIVAASGPSLTKEVADRCRKARWFQSWRIVCVSDSYRLFSPSGADILYSCDPEWWRLHDGAREFRGERWSSHHKDGNDKLEIAEEYGLKLVAGKLSPGFSTDPECIHYGHNSGFQAVNVAILKGATRIVLVGFDMRVVGKSTHFFGSHPKPLRDNTQFEKFIKAFGEVKPPVPIINATPGSALTCFPMMTLDEALSSASEPGQALQQAS
jgi:hypothetical protein